MPVTIKLTEEENAILKKIAYMDINKQWKYLSPYFYKDKNGYYEVYSKDEYTDLKEKGEL